MIQPPIRSSTDPNNGAADDTPVTFGTDNSDFLLGGPHDEVLAGVGGDDAIYGGQGNDDLDGGTGNDQLYGQDGNDVLAGGPGRDFLSGGAGHNVLRGGADADIYLIGWPHSQDVIDNAAGAASGDADMILFVKAVSRGMVFLMRDNDDLMIQIPLMRSSARVVDYFSGDGGTPHAVARLMFDDGTAWDLDTIKAMALQGSSHGDHLIGYASADTIEGKGGDDVIEGRGGADLLFGGDGNDVLDGGAGHDVLIGGTGSDSYFFGRGFGHDLIFSDGNRPGDTDCVHLGERIDEHQIWFRRGDDDLVLSIIGTTDSLRFKNWFTGAAAGFSTFQLSNEKSLAPDKIDALVAAMAAVTMPSSTAGSSVGQDQSQLGALIASSWVGQQGAA